MFLILTGMALVFAPPVFANPGQKMPDTKEKTAPESAKPKADKPDNPKKIEDLDAFFEKGERQSEDGPSCRPKSEPVA